MLGMLQSSQWQRVLNPFLNLDTSETITGHVSGRDTDIIEIITQNQNAVILAGASRIGKTSLLHYLQRPPHSQWSWRNELAILRDQLKLDDIHFVQMDLEPLEDIEDAGKLLENFIAQCGFALQSVLSPDPSRQVFNLKELRQFLRDMRSQMPDTRLFLMLDAFKRLGQPGTRSFPMKSGARNDQERGLALLDHCGAIRTLVELIDEFNNLGVILAIESLPLSRVAHQFSYISADLARFVTMTLQTFKWDDVSAFLAQDAENFGVDWANRFYDLSKNSIFSEAEQVWLREQAGTHPYLLHQLCVHAFEFKREQAIIHRDWIELEESDKNQLIEKMHERLSTFFARIWKKRLQEALETGTPETKRKFYEFVHLLAQTSASDVIETDFWDYLGPELHYILSNEGLLRNDPYQPIHYPGAILQTYLVQKAFEGDLIATVTPSPSIPVSSSGHWLLIQRTGASPERVSLSELEYRLLKSLLKRPTHCSDQQLIKEAWGKLIERGVFSQRMFQLRKKLRSHCDDIEIIDRYKGEYLLTHPEWLQLEGE